MSSLQHVNPKVRGIRVSPHSGLQSLAARITQEIAQVLAACLHPQLLKDKNFPQDVRLRAQRILEVCEGGSVGSYTASTGLNHVKQNITEFIMRRDAGAPSYAKDIIITAGSQRALMMVLRLLTSERGATQTGVLAPTPCPHTLPMLLDEAEMTMVPYQLMEDRGWAVDLDELHRAVKTARMRCEPRAIYISNPGNPTGHVQDWKSIEEVIRFAATERLLLLVDEVYQDCVYGQEKEFISYKRVLFEMGEEYSETVELVSFHCLSSACMGECGLRAGYMEMVNMDPEVMHVVDIMLDTDICAPVIGQLALDLMVNPPKPGDPSYDTYMQEIVITQATLSQNAQQAQEFLNDLPGMSCQPVMGGIYLYPCLYLPAEIIEQAEILGLEADVLYCRMSLEEEGVLLGAGCQHGETTGNYYLRLCTLVPPDILQEVLARLSSFQLRLMNPLPHPDRGVKDRDMGGNFVTQHEALCGEEQILS